jgi:SET domain-containing protein
MSYRTEPVTMWFDGRMVFRKSPIHGIGTFALQDIKAGETLMYVTGGLVYTPAEWDLVRFDEEMYNEARLSDTLRQITPKVYNYYFNHSCEPNTVDLSRHPTWTHYVAVRDIQAEEELTADYYVYGEGALERCACGSPHCRWPRQAPA